MKRAVIDIGSNSIRLTMYETNGRSFKILFREKIMAGLAGYVEHGALSDVEFAVPKRRCRNSARPWNLWTSIRRQYLLRRLCEIFPTRRRPFGKIRNSMSFPGS